MTEEKFNEKDIYYLREIKKAKRDSFLVGLLLSTGLFIFVSLVEIYLKAWGLF